MAKDMKTRKGKDGFHYPYTSPDLAIDATGKSNTKNLKKLIRNLKILRTTQFESIA